MQTMLLHGRATIVHGGETNARSCEKLNSHNVTRAYVCTVDYNHLKDGDEKKDKMVDCLRPVFNQDQCQRDMDNQCVPHDWTGNYGSVHPNPDFPDLVPKVK